jgi:hypothetical protein
MEVLGMSSSVCVGYLSFGATEGQFCVPTTSYGAVASFSQMAAESWVRNRGLGGIALAALVELEPAEGEPRPALTWQPAARSDWGDDLLLLPGVMAGKRPASMPLGSI